MLTYLPSSVSMALMDPEICGLSWISIPGSPPTVPYLSACHSRSSWGIYYAEISSFIGSSQYVRKCEETVSLGDQQMGEADGHWRRGGRVVPGEPWSWCRLECLQSILPSRPGSSLWPDSDGQLQAFMVMAPYYYSILQGKKIRTGSVWDLLIYLLRVTLGEVVSLQGWHPYPSSPASCRLSRK